MYILRLSLADLLVVAVLMVFPAKGHKVLNAVRILAYSPSDMMNIHRLCSTDFTRDKVRFPVIKVLHVCFNVRLHIIQSSFLPVLQDLEYTRQDTQRNSSV